jgi:hypothetical protein
MDSPDWGILKMVAPRSGREAKDALPEVVLQELRNAIGRLKYGTITIKVHGSKVTQIEIAEKKRFDGVAGFTEGEGI